MYKVQSVVYDTHGSDTLVQQMARNHGIRFAEHRQGAATRAVSDQRLLEAIRTKTIEHSGHKEMRQHVLNAVAKAIPSGEGFMFDRPKHGPRVPTDCLIAMSMAHSVAFQMYGEKRGVTFL